MDAIVHILITYSTAMNINIGIGIGVVKKEPYHQKKVIIVIVIFNISNNAFLWCNHIFLFLRRINFPIKSKKNQMVPCFQ